VSRARDWCCVRSAVCAETRAMKRGGSANSSHRALSGSPRSVRSRLARRRAHRFVFSLGFRSQMPLIFRHHIRRHRRTSALGTTSADLPAPLPISGAWTVGVCTRSPQSAWTRHTGYRRRGTEQVIVSTSDCCGWRVIGECPTRMCIFFVIADCFAKWRNCRKRLQNFKVQRS